MLAGFSIFLATLFRNSAPDGPIPPRNQGVSERACSREGSPGGNRSTITNRPRIPSSSSVEMVSDSQEYSLRAVNVDGYSLSISSRTAKAIISLEFKLSPRAQGAAAGSGSANAKGVTTAWGCHCRLTFGRRSCRFSRVRPPLRVGGLAPRKQATTVTLVRGTRTGKAFSNVSSCNSILFRLKAVLPVRGFAFARMGDAGNSTSAAEPIVDRLEY